MLKRVLQAMSRGEVHSHADLAKKLDVSADLLARMMEDLANKGYLVPLATPDGEGQSSCSACSKCKACATCSMEQSYTPTGWVLTKKGRAAVWHATQSVLG